MNNNSNNIGIKNKAQVANFLDMIGGELKEKITAPRGSKFAPEDSLFDTISDVTVKSEMLKNEIRNEIRNKQEQAYYEQFRQNGHNSYVSQPIVKNESLSKIAYNQKSEDFGPVQMELPLFNDNSNNIMINTDKLEILLKESIEVTNKINKSVTSTLIDMSNNILECTEILKEILAVLSIKGVVTSKSNNNDFDVEDNDSEMSEYWQKELDIKVNDDKKES